MTKLLIINYHKIYADQRDFSENGNRFWVSYSSFKDQLDFLSKRGINVVSISDWRRGLIQSEFAIALTFDDGFKSDISIVKDELIKRNFTASFYPICSVIDTPGHLSKKDLIELKNTGFDVGSHSYFHPLAKGLGQKDWYKELSNSKKYLEKILNAEVRSFAWPYGYLPKNNKNLISDVGYDIGLTTLKKINHDYKSKVLHRWNIKESTNLRVFENIINQKFPTFHLKSLLSRLKV